jgi:hypothetical protein
VVLAHAYVTVKDLAQAIEKEASSNPARYDDLLPETCAWAATFSPALSCPSPGMAGTASILEDSRAQLSNYAALIGTNADRLFFEQYDLIWGRGASRGRPWQNETLAAGVAFVEGCLSFDATFWTAFFAEVAKKQGAVRQQIYRDALAAQQDRATRALVDLNSPVCACSSQADVLQNLEKIQKAWKPNKAIPRDLLSRLAENAARIRKGELKIHDHARTQCGGG